MRRGTEPMRRHSLSLALVCLVCAGQTRAQAAKPRAQQGKKGQVPSEREAAVAAKNALISALENLRVPLPQKAGKLERYLGNEVWRSYTSERERRLLELRLAAFELALRRPRRALARFASVETRLRPKDRGYLEISARCALGAAQVSELLGESRKARQLYARVVERFPQSRFARIAKAAESRLRYARASDSRPRAWVFLSNVRQDSGKRLPTPSRDSKMLAVLLAPKAKMLPASLRPLFTERQVPKAFPKKLRVVVAFEDGSPGASALGKTIAASALSRAGRVFFVPIRRELRRLAFRELGLHGLPCWALLGPGFEVLDFAPSLRRILR